MTSDLIFRLGLDLACIVVCIIATITDIRSLKIPNWLTFSALGCGYLLNFMAVAIIHGLGQGFVVGFLPSLIGSGVLFVAFLFMAIIDAVGMGDVKLMAAVGAFVCWPLALWTLALVLLCGGVLAIIYSVKTGQFKKVLLNMIKMASKKKDKVTLHHMPYALAILLGVIFSIALRYRGFY